MSWDLLGFCWVYSGGMEEKREGLSDVTRFVIPQTFVNKGRTKTKANAVHSKNKEEMEELSLLLPKTCIGTIESSW